MDATAIEPGRLVQLDGFTLEYKLAPRMVVFSHGFGVRRDSRGMFTEIVANLPAGIGYVLFDYNNDENGATRTTYASEQVERLKKVVQWVSTQPTTEQIALIGHSRGCTIISLARLDGMQGVILLAPPLAAGHARQYFTGKPGSVRKGADWYVPRSDGSTTIIPDGIFDEFEQIDPEKALLAYAEMRPLMVIAAGADKVLPDQNFSDVRRSPCVMFATIDGASHDFVAAAREPLIREVNGYLSEAFGA